MIGCLVRQRVGWPRCAFYKMEVEEQKREVDQKEKKIHNDNSKSQTIGIQSLLIFTVLFLAWLVGFASRLFAVIRFESIIHEFDPW